MILSALVGALLQTTVVTLLALVVHLILRRTTRGFGDALGLTTPTTRALRLALILCVPMFGAALVIERLPELKPYFAKATGFNAHLRDPGQPLAPMLAAACVHGALQTALSEEILFRGLLGRLLGRRLGFSRANAVQSTLFALLHGAFPFFAGIELPVGVFVSWFVAFPFVVAWTMGWLNERYGNGSIAPGWVVHGVGNAAAYSWIVLRAHGVV